MRDWKTVRLDDLADIRISNVDKKSVASERPVRLCNYMDVYGNDYIDGRLAFMEATASQAEIERFKVQCGDVLITKDSETPDDIGIPAVVMEDVQGLVAGYHLALIRPRRDRVDPVYLAKQLSAERAVSHFSRRAAGSTRYGLSTSTIASTPILVAPLPVQRCIAEILSTLDSAMEKTEEIIEKYSQIRMGMAQQFFLYGLRQDREKSSKETRFGPIPAHWEIGSLADVTDRYRQPILTGPFGAELGNDDFVAEGTPILRIGNVQHGWINLEDLLFVKPSKARQLQRYSVREGDLLFARQGATTGRNALASGEVNGFLINYHIIRVALDQARCEPLFIEAAFASDLIIRQIERDKGRGTREGINTSQLTALQIPIAPLAEQRRIAEVLEGVSAQIKLAEKQLRKLRATKRGVARDLLYGNGRRTKDVSSSEAS
jgi:type I restriction enzyme S subunit